MDNHHDINDAMEKGVANETAKDGLGEALDTPIQGDAIAGPTSKTESRPEESDEGVPSESEGLWNRLSRKAFSRSRKGDATGPEEEKILPQPIKVRKLEDCPKGYPRLAAFVDSDENFMLYRRFGFLHTRVLLNKQDELRELEFDLDFLDKDDEILNPRSLISREIDLGRNKTRRDLLRDIEMKLREYGDLLMLGRDIAGLKRPPKKDFESVRRYFGSTAPLVDPESYIYRREDIVSLKPGRETAWLDSAVEGLLERLVTLSPLIQRIFSTQDLLEKTNYEKSKIILYSQDKVGVVVLIIILTVILAILIVPVYLLQRLMQSPTIFSSTTFMIMILLLFTLLFSLVLSKFTGAKRHEILASAAAYCAVLVVFVGNVSQLSSAKTPS